MNKEFNDFKTPLTKYDNLNLGNENINSENYTI